MPYNEKEFGKNQTLCTDQQESSEHLNHFLLLNEPIIEDLE